MRLFLTALAALLTIASVEARVAARHLGAMVRVNVTSQEFDNFRPWRKKQPTARQGLGVLVGGGRVLVTGRLVENSTFIELEKIDSGERFPARIEAVDYLANLAVIKAEDSAFLAGMKSVKVADHAHVGDVVTAVQFEENGTPRTAEGEIRAVEVSDYPYGLSSLLVYRVEIGLDNTGSSYTLPVMRRGKLVGLLMSYGQSARRATLTAAPVISHFLADLSDGVYDGFPRAGFGFSSMPDPQLRRYVGLPDDNDGGIYITAVIPQSPAALGGLQEGDVLMSIDGFAIDKHGEYRDPDYGKLSVAHLTNTLSYTGQTRRFTVLREGEQLTLSINMSVVAMAAYPIRPLSIDREPDYLVIGGLVLQELTRSYLEEWGGNWPSSAPQRLVYYDRHQWDLFEPGQHIVILSQILAFDLTIGYESLRYLPVTKINDIEIRSLIDASAALRSPVAGYHIFEFAENPGRIVLDAALTARCDPIIQQLYRLPSLHRIAP